MEPIDHTVPQNPEAAPPTGPDHTGPADPPPHDHGDAAHASTKAADPPEPPPSPRHRQRNRSPKPPAPPTGDTPPEGNRDDAAEKDMGQRAAVMGESGAAVKPGADPTPPETDRQRADRMERELADLRRAVDLIVPAEARRVLSTPVSSPAPAAPLPGEGPAVWEGSLPTDKVMGAPVRFRGPENEAEAREHYLRHAGVRHTTHRISLHLVTD